MIFEHLLWWIGVSMLLAGPYCYILSLIIFEAYFKCKANYQRKMLHELEFGSATRGNYHAKEDA